MSRKLLKSIRPIQYITMAYAILYVLFIISGDFGGAYPSLNPEGIGVYLLFVLFIIGFSFSWYNGIITGILFLLWNVGMWIVELFLVGSGGGFGIISGVPLLVLGVLYIVGNYKIQKLPVPMNSQIWKLVLRVLATTYTILYLIFIIDNFNPNYRTDLFIWPGAILTVALGIYLIGFLFSWKWEQIAGISFIIWYGCLLIPDLQPIAYKMGPLKLMGLPVLIQGILYLYYHFIIKSKQI